MNKRNGEASDSDIDNDQVDEYRSGLDTQEHLLVNDRETEARVGLRYLIALTCGVGGLVHIKLSHSSYP